MVGRTDEWMDIVGDPERVGIEVMGSRGGGELLSSEVPSNLNREYLLKPFEDQI